MAVAYCKYDQRILSHPTHWMYPTYAEPFRLELSMKNDIILQFLTGRCHFRQDRHPAARSGTMNAFGDAMLSREPKSELITEEVPQNNKSTAPQRAWGSPKPREPRPDHFLAVQVSHSPTVSAAISDIHAALVEHSPYLKDTLVDPITAHITLGVMALPDETAKALAVTALQDAGRAVMQQNVLQLYLRGLGTFNQEVLYIDVADDSGREQLSNVATVVRQHFFKGGLLLQAKRDYVPHVTVAKVSKMGNTWSGRRGKIRNTRGGRGRSSQVGTASGGQICTANEDSIPNQENNGQGEHVNDDMVVGQEEHGGQAVAPCRDKAHRHQRLQIVPEAYEQHLDVDVGCVEVFEVQLCRMQGRKEGEYYEIVSRVSIKQSVASPDADVEMSDLPQSLAEPDANALNLNE